jgi:hypothetical protein
MRYETLTQALDSRTSASVGGRVDGEDNNRRTYYAATSRIWSEQAQARTDDAPTINRSLSFDISNNRILASVDMQGIVRSIVVAHGAEPVYGQEGLPGVYVDKVLRVITHPKAFGVRLNGAETWEALPTSHMQLLGDFLPHASFTHDGLDGTVLSFAPIGRNGHVRPRAIVTILRLRNTGDHPLAGAVAVPGVSDPEPDTLLEPATELGRHEGVALLEGKVDGGRWRYPSFALST